MKYWKLFKLAMYDVYIMICKVFKDHLWLLHANSIIEFDTGDSQTKRNQRESNEP